MRKWVLLLVICALVFADSYTPPSLLRKGITTSSSSSPAEGTFPQNTNTVANQFFTAYNSTTGAFSLAQPLFSNLSGSATDAQIPNNITIDFATTAGTATNATNATTADSATTAGSATTATTAGALSGNPANCSAGSTAGGIAANGAVEDCIAVPSLVASGNAGISFYNAGTATTAARSDHQHLPANIINQTPIGSATNNTAEQNLQAVTIPAGALNAAGRKVDIFSSIKRTSGSTSAATTVTYRIKLCTVSGCGSGTVLTLVTVANTGANTTGGTAANASDTIRAEILTVATGATGTLEGHGTGCIQLGLTAGGAATCFNDITTAVSSTIDLTAQLFIQTTFQVGANGTGNTTHTASQRSLSVAF
jgi:hypothetical protein